MREIETGGKGAYVGYEYQILTSVWVALYLMLSKKVATEIEIEPASDEDIAAKLKVAAPSSTLIIQTGSVNLQIQVKHRSSPWGQSAFRSLLDGKEPADREKKASKPAKKAASEKPKAKRTARLMALAILAEDPSAQYLLITDGPIDPRLRVFEIASLEERSGAVTLPWAAGEKDSADVPGRIAILPGRTRELLELTINEQLAELGSVPSQKRLGCRKALEEAVRLRLLNRLSGKWSIDEVRNIIEKHGGFPDPGQTAVLPEKFEDLEARLTNRNAVLITGSPGSGKTILARELVRRQQLGPHLAELILGSDGLGAVNRAMEANGKHIFLIEDPWGAYQVDREADLWQKALPDLVSRASLNNRFVITTRTSVRQSAMGEKLPPELARIEVELQPEDYSRDAKVRIFLQALGNVKPWQKDWAVRYLHEILARLTAPFSLVMCAREIRETGDEESLSIDALLRKCGVETLADTFAVEIRGRQDDSVEAALALWAWQTTEHVVSEDSAGALRNALATGRLEPVPDVRKLHRWLGSSGWWERHPAGLVGHPTVLAGAESLATVDPEKAERVFGALLAGLVAIGDPQRAFTIRQQVRKHVSSLAPGVDKAVAQYAVESLLAADQSEWQQAFYRVQAVDLQGSPVGILLNALKLSFEHIWHQWKRPELEPSDALAVRNSPEAREVARRWVLSVLPRTDSSEYDGESLADFLRSIGFDFAQEFFDLAVEELENGNGNSALGTIAAAALSGPAPKFEEILELALASYTEAVSFEEKNWDAFRQAAQDEVEPHFFESLNDDLLAAFAPSKAVLESAVEMRRKREGWHWLIEKSRPPILWRFWTNVIGSEAPDVELAAIDQRFSGSDRRYYWQAVANSGRRDLVPGLLSELLSLEGESLQRCLEQVSKLVPPEEWNTVIPGAIAQVPWCRRATLSLYRRPAFRAQEEEEWMPGAFSPDERAALALCDAAAKGSLDEPNAAPATLALLRELAKAAEPHIAGLALVALASLDEEIGELVPRLEQSEQGVARLAALVAQKMAGSEDMPEELLAALGDPHFRVRIAAIDILAPTAAATERELILDLAVRDPSATVRMVCAGVIARERWCAGEPVLVELLNDRHDFGSPHEGPEFRVAQEAARGLRALWPLTANAIEQAHAILARHGRGCQDILVLYELILSLAGQNDSRLVPLFVRSLRSHRYVPAYHSSGYPLRYAAAWTLWRHLGMRPDDVELVDARAVAEAAAHDDDRLAAPALLVLGRLQGAAFGHLRSVIEAETFTRESGLLIAMALPADATDSRAALREAIGESNSAWALLDLPLDQWPKEQEAWRRFLSRQPDFLEWLRSIRGENGLFPCIRFVLRMMLNIADPDELPPAFPFRDHFPQLPSALALGTFAITD